MAEFYFYQNRKVICWERDTFVVNADSYKDAVSIVKAHYGDGVLNETDDRIRFDECRTLCETSEDITPEENGGSPTIEVFDDYDNFIISNVPSYNNSNEDAAPTDKEGRPIRIGFQVKWCDPATDDLTEDEKIQELNRIYIVDDIYGDIVLISDETSEVETYPSELIVV